MIDVVAINSLFIIVPISIDSSQFTMESSKAERQLMTDILSQVEIVSQSKDQQAGLMQALGFESDVPFAKSLFSDTLAQQYRRSEYTSSHLVASLRPS